MGLDQKVAVELIKIQDRHFEQYWGQLLINGRKTSQNLQKWTLVSAFSPIDLFVLAQIGYDHEVAVT